jgi:hypothetical protein
MTTYLKSQPFWDGNVDIATEASIRKHVDAVSSSMTIPMEYARSVTAFLYKFMRTLHGQYSESGSISHAYLLGYHVLRHATWDIVDRPPMPIGPRSMVSIDGQISIMHAHIGKTMACTSPLGGQATVICQPGYYWYACCEQRWISRFGSDDVFHMDEPCPAYLAPWIQGSF